METKALHWILKNNVIKNASRQFIIPRSLFGRPQPTTSRCVVLVEIEEERYRVYSLVPHTSAWITAGTRAHPSDRCPLRLISLKFQFRLANLPISRTTRPFVRRLAGWRTVASGRWAEGIPHCESFQPKLWHLRPFQTNEFVIPAKRVTHKAKQAIVLLSIDIPTATAIEIYNGPLMTRRGRRTGTCERAGVARGANAFD